MSLHPPVEKLPLTVRKNIRDGFDAKVPELQERMSKLGFPGYAFVANPNQLYAYAQVNYAKNSTGNCIYEYFETFVERVEQFIKESKDADPVESLKKVTPKNTAVLIPDEEKRFSYGGCDIHDGQIRLLFHPEKLGYNIHDVANELYKTVDVALDAQRGDELPIKVQRGIVEYLDGKIPAIQAKLEKVLGKPFILEADVAKNFEFLRTHSAELQNQGDIEYIPEFAYRYFEAAASKLEYKEFGKDEMLKDAFNDAAEKGVIRFEIVEKLQHNSYNDCIFADGEFKLQTVPKKLGVNIADVVDDVLERL